MKHSVRTGVAFGVLLTLINGSFELVPFAYANLVAILSIAAWITCVGMAGALTHHRHPQASAALAAIVVVGVDSIRSASAKIFTGATAMVQNGTGTLQPIHMTPGMIILINVVIFLALAVPAAGVGWAGARLDRLALR